MSSYDNNIFASLSSRKPNIDKDGNDILVPAGVHCLTLVAFNWGQSKDKTSNSEYYEFVYQHPQFPHKSNLISERTYFKNKDGEFITNKATGDPFWLDTFMQTLIQLGVSRSSIATGIFQVPTIGNQGDIQQLIGSAKIMAEIKHKKNDYNGKVRPEVVKYWKVPEGGFERVTADANVERQRLPKVHIMAPAPVIKASKLTSSSSSVEDLTMMSDSEDNKPLAAIKVDKKSNATGKKRKESVSSQSEDEGGNTSATEGKVSKDSQLEKIEQQEAKRLKKDQEKKEKEAEKARKEAEKLAEKARKEAEKLAEKARKEAELRAAKEQKEQERLAEKARKEAELKAAKEQKEREREIERQQREAKKLSAQMEKMRHIELEKQRKLKERGSKVSSTNPTGLVDPRSFIDNAADDAGVDYQSGDSDGTNSDSDSASMQDRKSVV